MPLFFTMFIEHCKKNGYVVVQTLDVTTMSSEHVNSQLSCQFLGSRSYFWLKDISALDAKKKAFWNSFISVYEGPNCLIFFSDKKLACRQSTMVSCIDIPQEWDINDLHILFDFFVPGKKQSALLVAKFLSGRRRKVSLDTICLLIKYAQVADHDLELFLTQWLDLIVVPESSLFDVSKYFFARNAQAFFKLWHSIAPTYGELFWVAYWSDILWRAYHFIRYSNNGQHADAKKMAPRLPFSFIQGGWRQVSSRELKNMMDVLYSIDANLKSGSQGYHGLEVMYLKFFLRQF